MKVRVSSGQLKGFFKATGLASLASPARLPNLTADVRTVPFCSHFDCFRCSYEQALYSCNRGPWCSYYAS